ncbi:MAG: hypothetical protein O2913_07325 [Chloroflexi bacterium]|nr:hypothetical protein [Chloroflexota bacterium]
MGSRGVKSGKQRGGHIAQVLLPRLLRNIRFLGFWAIIDLRVQLVQPGIIVRAALQAQPVAVVCS